MHWFAWYVKQYYSPNNKIADYEICEKDFKYMFTVSKNSWFV